MNSHSQALWTALSAIATFVMAFATFYMAWITREHLLYYKRTDEERTFREIIDNLVLPLISDIDRILSNITKCLSLSGSYWTDIGEVWKWPHLKPKFPYLISRLPKSLKEGIENFTKKFETFVNSENQCSYKLDEVLSRELEKKIPKKVKTKKGREFTRCKTWYFLEIGGKRFQVTIAELLFVNQTLSEYIENLIKAPTLPNKDVEDEYFVADGVRREELGRQDVEEILSTVSEKINQNVKLRKFLESCRAIEKEAKELKESLVQYSKNGISQYKMLYLLRRLWKRWKNLFVTILNVVLHQKWW